MSTSMPANTTMTYQDIVAAIARDISEFAKDEGITDTDELVQTYMDNLTMDVFDKLSEEA